jgi:hypothetical protein
MVKAGHPAGGGRAWTSICLLCCFITGVSCNYNVLINVLGLVPDRLQSDRLASPCPTIAGCARSQSRRRTRPRSRGRVFAGAQREVRTLRTALPDQISTGSMRSTVAPVTSAMFGLSRLARCRPIRMYSYGYDSLSSRLNCQKNGSSTSGSGSDRCACVQQ